MSCDTMAGQCRGDAQSPEGDMQWPKWSFWLVSRLLAANLPNQQECQLHYCTNNCRHQCSSITCGQRKMHRAPCMLVQAPFCHHLC